MFFVWWFLLKLPVGTWLRTVAVERLDRYGERSVPSLVRALSSQNQNWRISRLAADSLGRIGSIAAADSLALTLGHPFVTDQAARALTRIYKESNLDYKSASLPFSQLATDAINRFVNDRLLSDHSLEVNALLRTLDSHRAQWILDLISEIRSAEKAALPSMKFLEMRKTAISRANCEHTWRGVYLLEGESFTYCEKCEAHPGRRQT